MKNMKKFKTIAFAIACLIISPLILSACSKDDDKVTVSSVSINNLDNYYMTSASDAVFAAFDSVTLTVKYSDDSTKTLSLKEYDVEEATLTTTEFILNTDGLYTAAQSNPIAEDTYEISCTLVSDNKTYPLTTVTITDDLSAYYEVVKFEAPELLTTYTANLTRNTTDTTADTYESSYYTTKVSYYVGDDNAFKFAPILTVMSLDDQEGNYIMLTNFNVTVSVSYNGNDLDLTNNAYVTYSYDSTFSFDFTEDAIGESFTITMSLDDFDTDYAGNAIPSYSMTVTVADGWNVYDALDLGRMNLVSDEFNASNYIDGVSRASYWESGSSTFVTKQTCDIWKNYLAQELNLADTSSLTSVNGIFLHSNITLTCDNIPSEFIISQEEVNAMGDSSVTYVEDLVGSIRDWSILFIHYMESGDFTFNGNLFNIDASALTWGMSNASLDYYYYKSSADTKMGHSSLFAISGLSSTQYTATFCNFDSIGNTAGILSSTDGDATGASGSLVFLKAIRTQVVVNNVICKNYMIGYSVESTEDSYVGLAIKYAKIYDSYSSGLYTWDSGNNTITDSTIKRTGGSAAVLVDDAGSSTRKTGFTITNTVIECYVNGNEAWFTLNGASSVVTQFADLDDDLKPLGKTFYNSEDKMNVISIILDDGYLGSEATKLDVDFTYAGLTLHMAQKPAETDSVATYINTVVASKVPVFMTNSGTLFITDGSTGFYTLASYMTYLSSSNKTDLVAMTFAATDTTLYVVYPVSSTVICVAVEIYDYSTTTTTE